MNSPAICVAFGLLFACSPGAQAGTVDMQPEVVSKLLSEVAHKWVTGALAVMRHEVTADAELSAMKKSCSKVAASVVGGSEGDKSRTEEYFREVCSESAAGADRDMCLQFANGLIGKLSDDAYTNREDLNVNDFCVEFYNGAVQKSASEQSKVLEARDAEKAEASKKQLLRRLRGRRRPLISRLLMRHESCVL